MRTVLIVSIFLVTVIVVVCVARSCNARPSPNTASPAAAPTQLPFLESPSSPRVPPRAPVMNARMIELIRGDASCRR